jgi:hypothetical protein
VVDSVGAMAYIQGLGYQDGKSILADRGVLLKGI